jgi:hypothetical protein
MRKRHWLGVFEKEAIEHVAARAQRRNWKGVNMELLMKVWAEFRERSATP